MTLNPEYLNNFTNDAFLKRLSNPANISELERVLIEEKDQLTLVREKSKHEKKSLLEKEDHKFTNK